MVTVNKITMKIFLSIFKLLIKFSLIFMIFYIWLRYYLTSTIKAGVISLICAVIIILILDSISKPKQNYKNLKQKEKEEAEQMFFSLIKNKDYLFFYNLAKTRNKNVEKKRIYLLVKNEENKIMLYPYLKIKPLGQDDLLTIISVASKEKVQKIVICASDIEKETYSFAKTLEEDIVLLDKYETYQYLFKEYQYFPQTISKTQLPKKSKVLFDYAFSKLRTKSYLLSAFLLLIISFIFQQNLYYCIVATILIIFALICIIKPKDKHSLNNPL